MAVTLIEGLMTPGEITADLSVLPDELYALIIPRTTHLLLYRGAELRSAHVILRRPRRRDGVKITGRGLDWRLGDERDGAVIEWAEFIGGRNKLANPITPEAGLGGLCWILAADTDWSLVSNPGYAIVNGHLDDHDDVFACDQVFPARPGDLYHLGGRWLRIYDTRPGALRARLICHGRYAKTNLAHPFAEWGTAVVGDITLGTDPEGIVAGPCFRLHTAVPNRAPNGAFDDGVGLNGWVQGAGAWYPITDGTAWSLPTYAMTDTSIVVAGIRSLTSSSDGGVTPPAVPYAVRLAETWEVRLVVRDHPGAGTDGEAYGRIVLSQGGVFRGYIETAHVGAGSQDWTIIQHRVTIPEGVDGLTFDMVALNMTTGQWDFDSGTVIRVAGNIDTVTEPTLDVTGERTYNWKTTYRVDPNQGTGTGQLQAVASGPGRPDKLLTGPELKLAEIRDPGDHPGMLQEVTWPIVIPSGYETIDRRVYCEDFVGEMWVGEGTLVDADSATRVFDVRSGTLAGTEGTFSLDVTVPDGTETVGVALVAEGATVGYGAWDMDLHRRESPVTVRQVFETLLRDPETGLPLMEPGTVYGGDIIQFDWTIRNLPAGAAITRLARAGVALPPREIRVNPDNTMDLGTAEQIFVDHVPTGPVPIVIAAEDVVVRDGPEVDEADDDRLSRVKAVGATTTGPSGVPTSITAVAEDPPDALDWYGRPYHRSRIIADATVDHPVYAAALARHVLDTANARARTAKTVLADPIVLGDVRPGEWVYVADPVTGLDDPGDPVPHDGRTVWPERIRVAEARWEIGGPPYRLVLRTGDGVEHDIDEHLVQWSDATTVALSLGEVIAEPETDDQGGPAGIAFLRRQASDPGRR